MLRRVLLLAVVFCIRVGVQGQNTVLLNAMIESSANIFAVRVESVEQTGITWTLGTINDLIEGRITKVYKGTLLDSSVYINQRLICDINDPSQVYRPVPIQANQEYIVFLLAAQKMGRNGTTHILYHLKDNVLGILPWHPLLEKEIQAIVKR